jgi:hypothetical protein
MNDETVLSARRPTAHCGPGIAAVIAASLHTFPVDPGYEAERIV